jgi:hypothetical protein
LKRAVWIAGACLAIGIRWTAAATPPSTDASGAAASAESRKALATLEEILRSKSDNDPRLDSDFNALSAETKRLFRRKYHQIPLERRNERGTIVSLLGRSNLRAPEDWAFLREVAAEPPCLSLSNCSKKPKPGGDEEAEGDEVTLAYTSLVALKQAEHALEAAGAADTPEKSAAASEARRVLNVGRKSSTRAVSRLASVLSKKFSRP